MSKPVAVIGSGPTGAVAAQVLIEQGISVVMLESGDRLPHGVMVRAMGRTIFRKKPALDPRGAALSVGRNPEIEWWVHLDPGGLSNQWTGGVPRFSPEDFTEGEQLDPCYRWPVDYAELVPFYERVERILEVSGGRTDIATAPRGDFRYHSDLPRAWQGVDKVARARGQALIPAPIAHGAPWMAAWRGTAFNSFLQLVVPLLNSPDFQLHTGAHVLRLEYDATKQRVKSVLYQDRATGEQHRIEVGGVVVACGALNSTKLLFDSACPDFPEGLGNSDGVLGRYLHDHPHEWCTLELSKPIARLPNSIYLTRRPFGSPALLAAGLTLGAASPKEQILASLPLPSRALGVQVMGSMIPTLDNFALPDSNKKDPFGSPQLRVCMDYDKDIRANMNLARKNLQEILSAAGYDNKIVHEPNFLRPGSSVHYGGTVRMHHSREFGMLDGWNRLHTVPNVLVTDISCFTTCPEKRPTLTAMALSWRAAERLALDLKRGTCV
ncbi:GMC oxidoreductase [Armatimonas sp.]|uniref:GMC oxidoreductase n=1 Tax=Armatimonas sp. TaxID=1872638 RepID=UPI0037500AD3